MTDKIRLTAYSHGAGCGCKISPRHLDQILKTQLLMPEDKRLLVGNDKRDDAAVYDLGNGQAIISTTDFFMPIVDDPYDFGRIAATNAISDVYAMGGRPLLAIAILGWPLEKLGPEIAGQVVDGGRQVCKEAGIPLAGGHSIDAPEPIFGLAVTGIVNIDNLKTNHTAKAGDLIYLTKPLGIGILTTAEKKRLIEPEHQHLATETMCLLNRAGEHFGTSRAIHAMTDVTGFGLLGHLSEMCQGSGLQALLYERKVPRLPGVDHYVQLGCIPGGSKRNFDSYGHLVSPLGDHQRAIFCDPQTSGGLLVAVDPEEKVSFLELSRENGLSSQWIGEFLPSGQKQHLITFESE